MTAHCLIKDLTKSTLKLVDIRFELKDKHYFKLRCKVELGKDGGQFEHHDVIVR